ncbi:MAG: T9SS type A sorting domain-containing protein [Bacteroidia bacterium]|jgi:hypothetical protein
MLRLTACSIVCLFGLSAILTAQANYSWVVNGIQAGDFAEISDVAVDANGNSYVLLNYTEPVSFGSVSLNSIGEQDLAVVKFDPQGNALWGVNAGSATSDRGNSIALDNAGACYVTGYITGDATFGIFPPIQDNLADLSTEFFVGKLSNAGQWLWVRQQSSQAIAEGRDIAVDNAGDVVVGGTFYAADLALDGEVLQAGEQLPFIAKYDAVGTIQWGFAPAASNSATFSALTITPDNWIGFTGSFGSGEVGESIFTAGNIELINQGDPEELVTASDVYVLVLDAQGLPLWGQNAGSIYIEAYSSSIASGPDNQIYVSGYFQDFMQSPDFSVEISALGGADDYDFFVGSINSSGNWDWLSSVGNESYNLGNLSLASSDNGVIYLAGSLNELPIEFGSDQLQAEGANASFIARMFTDGSFQWGFALPELYTFEVLSENIIHACGKFSGSVAFGDTTLSSTTAASDVYHARIVYGPDLPSTADDAFSAAISVFPNPFTNILSFQTEEEIEKVQIFDAIGRLVLEDSGSTKRIVLDHLHSGNYFIRFVGKRGLITKSLVKL